MENMDVLFTPSLALSPSSASLTDKTICVDFCVCCAVVLCDCGPGPSLQGGFTKIYPTPERVAAFEKLMVPPAFFFADTATSKARRETVQKMLTERQEKDRAYRPKAKPAGGKPPTPKSLPPRPMTTRSNPEGGSTPGGTGPQGDVTQSVLAALAAAKSQGTIGLTPRGRPELLVGRGAGGGEVMR
ncbi:hypothetical protein PAPYR_10622 [Paratrimastix pyriformis]|uniref:Uncharacterized protein n=1 Tax=Paratrimastix pyriformis TaxID=342808 RepID=A0ABQ8U9B3_9EUKA|nr:hypothetical protein PAPYR_10622 [Paratrimastix pyriformis]